MKLASLKKSDKKSDKELGCKAERIFRNLARIKKDEGVNKASKDLYELALSGRDLIFYKNFKPDKTSVHDEHKFEINGQNPSIRF